MAATILDIHLDALQRTDRAEFVFLQNAQKFDLKFDWQIAHFVEKSGGASAGESRSGRVWLRPHR